MRSRRIWVAVGAGTCVVGIVASSAAASFTTPQYGMTCDSGYVSHKYGWATCDGPNPAKWKIRINCRYGFNYDSNWVYTGPDETYTLRYPANCYYGANSVTVVEGR